MNDTPLFIIYFVVGAIGGATLGLVVGYSWSRLMGWVADCLRHRHIERRVRRANNTNEEQ